jgi:hypothetical protein
LKSAQAELQSAKELSDLHWAEAELANKSKSEFLANRNSYLFFPENSDIRIDGYELAVGWPHG